MHPPTPGAFTKAKSGAGDVAQLIECLSSMPEVLESVCMSWRHTGESQHLGIESKMIRNSKSCLANGELKASLGYILVTKRPAWATSW